MSLLHIYYVVTHILPLLAGADTGGRKRMNLTQLNTFYKRQQQHEAN